MRSCVVDRLVGWWGDVSFRDKEGSQQVLRDTAAVNTHRSFPLAVMVAASVFCLGACGSNSNSPGGGPGTGSPIQTTTSAAETVPPQSSTESSTVPGESTSTSITTPAADSTMPVSSQPPLGCTTGRTQIPDGATRGSVVDVDADRRPDTAWIATAADGTVTVGVVTAAGGGANRLFASASPVRRSILVVDTDQRPPVEILADTGRSVQLWAFQDCAIVDITDSQGKPYEFSLGFTDIGTGVGCVTIDGLQELVGLHAKENGDTVNWSRTIVDLDGTRARNGATSTGTFTRPGDDQKIELLHQVTCGEMTIGKDGLTATP